MQISQSASLRMEQRQLLTPRMIQSMEILQLPLGRLEERIEQELEKNPVLEMRSGEGDDYTPDPTAERGPERNGTLEVDPKDGAADFDRLDRIANYLENEEFSTNGTVDHARRGYWQGEDGRDGKLDALNNTAARAGNLSDHLMQQWTFVEVPPAVKLAGEAIIDFLDPDGYLKTPFDALSREHKKKPTVEALQRALPLIQKLEPAGVAARDLRECLLLQVDAIERDPELAEGHEIDLERALVRDHLKDLEQNRYPLIARKLDVEISDIKDCVRRLARLTPHPGKSVVPDDAPAVNPDAIIEKDETTGEYTVTMTRDPAPDLQIRAQYAKLLKDKAQDKSLRQFLSENVRNAQWLIESIEQRRSTIERVIRKVVEHQKDYFDQGPQHLHALPMIQVAEELGVHVATISRAVAEKYIQTPRGMMPLRRFFSGGTTTDDGQDMSWDAVKAKLEEIIGTEDKQKPLSDDQLVEKLQEDGIDIARRTVAKYRGLLNIPTARQRKEF